MTEMPNKLSVPNVFGPGTWFSMHVIGANVKNINDLFEGCKTIKTILTSLKCLECRNHALEYEKANPLDKLLICKHTNHTGGKMTCLHKWLVDFHNTVNKRLNKPIVSADIAYQYYSNLSSGVCAENCN